MRIKAWTVIPISDGRGGSYRSRRGLPTAFPQVRGGRGSLRDVSEASPCQEPCLEFLPGLWLAPFSSVQLSQGPFGLFIFNLFMFHFLEANKAARLFPSLPYRKREFGGFLSALRSYVTEGSGADKTCHRSAHGALRKEVAVPNGCFSPWVCSSLLFPCFLVSLCLFESIFAYHS